MLRTSTLIASILPTVTGLIPCAVSSAADILCERVDDWDQTTGVCGARVTAQSASSPFLVIEFDGNIVSGETSASWSANIDTACNSNDASCIFEIEASNPTPSGYTTYAPQTSLVFGGIIDASASATDTNGAAQSVWQINPYLDDPAVAQGQFEVLGDTESATLTGEIVVIITLNPSGNWVVGGTWEVYCADSWLVGVRGGGNDGWSVDGQLHSGGNVDVVDEFWSDNVNEGIFVDQDTETGNFHSVAIVAAREPYLLTNGVLAVNSGPTNSTCISGFSFGSSFSVED